MASSSIPSNSRSMIENNQTVSTYDVFLGGSCNPTTWRRDIAIPYLKHVNLSYFNPQVVEWTEERIAIEHAAKENSTVLLYVIDNETRNVVSGIEVAKFAGYYKNIVLVIIPKIIVDGSTMNGEQITLSEARDALEFVGVLRHIAYDQDICVFEDIPSALIKVENIVRRMKGNAHPEEQNPANRTATPHEMFEIFVRDGNEIVMCNTRIAIRLLTHYNMCDKEVLKLIPEYKVNENSERITYDQFCVIIERCFTLPKKLCCRFGHSTDQMSLVRMMHSMPEKYLSMTRPKKIVDIYLVGDFYSENLWKKSIAIPRIKRHYLTFNSAKKADLYSMLNAQVLLFVISNTSRSMETMAMAAYCIAKGCKVVLCVQSFTKLRCMVYGEKLTRKAMDDFNRGRMYLKDLALREKVPVLESITGAVEMAINKLNIFNCY